MKDTIMNYIIIGTPWYTIGIPTFYFQSNINLILKCYGITGISILYTI